METVRAADFTATSSASLGSGDCLEGAGGRALVGEEEGEVENCVGRGVHIGGYSVPSACVRFPGANIAPALIHTAGKQTGRLSCSKGTFSWVD